MVGVGEDSGYQPDKHTALVCRAGVNMAAQLASRNVVLLLRRSELLGINGI